MAHGSHEQLHALIAQLDQALLGHEQWYRDLMRTLIVRLPPDPADLAADAHQHCRLGQWCHGDLGGLSEHPALAALRDAHEEIHRDATHLLQHAASGLPISAGLLDDFNSALERMRQQVQALHTELGETTQNRDALTGARTRATLLADLREQQALVRRGVQKCALAMIDLDHFKKINDRHGHAAGDALLSTTVQCLQGLLRPYDRIYRYGGEEFLLCLPNTSVDAAVGMAGRLRAAVSAQQIQHAGAGTTLRVTASFGIAEMDAMAPVEESIDRADKAMYRAKKAGRDRVKAWNEIATDPAPRVWQSSGRAKALPRS